MIRRPGFTIFEIVVSVALMAIVLGVGIFFTLRFFQDNQLKGAATTAVSYLRTAASRSLAHEGDESHGVRFLADRITLFRGPSYAGRLVAYDTTLVIPAYVTVSGLAEIVFAEQAGRPSATGAIVFSNGYRTYTVTVNAAGSVYLQ
jgi:Tfp pilus assembly protein FimT